MRPKPQFDGSVSRWQIIRAALGHPGEREMPDPGKTFRLRYVGRRFEGKRLAVDVLLDLPAFRDLLIAFAKDEWRNANSGRQRVPKGFDKSISLDLIEIEDGSAVPVLNWDRQTAQTTLPGFQDELEYIVDRSFEDIVELIHNAGNDKYPRSLSSEHIRALNKFGSGLRDGERIEFIGSNDNEGFPVFLDGLRRKKLITRVRETYETRVDGSGKLLGSVIEDTFAGHIVVDTFEFGQIKIQLPADRVTEEFDGNIGSDIQFDFRVELDNNDRLRGVVEVFDIGLVDARIGSELLRCRERILELKALAAGWHDGEGLAIDPTSLDAAEVFLSKKFHLSGAYKIYPMETGQILIEFETNGWDFSIEFGPGADIEMYGVEIDGEGEMEPTTFSGVSEGFLKEFDSRVRR